MKMFDCDICLSAGSVNQWGFCEICGEEYEDLESLVDWQLSSTAATEYDGQVLSGMNIGLTSIKQDAA